MTALDDRLRDAAVAVREEMEHAAIPEAASLHRGGRPRRPALLALVGAAALVVVISAVVAFGSRDRHPETRSQPPSIAAGSALTVSDLPAGWKAEPSVENARPNCLPSFTNTALDQATRQFVGPSGEILQEIVAYEPDDAHEEFDLANRAMQRCSNKPPDLPAMGDESAAYFVSPVRGPTAGSGDANYDAAVALVRLGDVRIDVIVFRQHGIDEHTLEPLVRAAVRVVTRSVKPCGLGDLAFDYYGGGGATGNDFGTIRIRNTATLPCLLKGSIGIAGTDHSGKVVTQSLAYPVATALVLTARATRVPAGQEPGPGEVVGELLLSAAYRDDTAPGASNELCLAHEVIPASWRLTLLAGARTVVNASSPKSEFSSLITCRGQLNVASVVTADFDQGTLAPPPPRPNP